MLNKFPEATINNPETVEKPKFENAETKKEIELKIQNELSRQGKMKGIDFSFPEPRLKIAPEKLPSELDWSYFSPEISEVEREDLSFCFNQLCQYLDSPIIADNFSDHKVRRDWEDENLPQLGPEVQKYYEHNRLGLNFSSGLSNVINLLNLKFQAGSFINSDAINKLNILRDFLPPELQSGCSDDYARLSTEEKIALSDKLASLISAALWIIGRIKLEQVN